MATAERDLGTRFRVKAPRSAHLMVSCLAHPEAQPDGQDASAGKPLGHKKVMEAKSTPFLVTFGTFLKPSLRYTKKFINLTVSRLLRPFVLFSSCAPTRSKIRVRYRSRAVPHRACLNFEGPVRAELAARGPPRAYSSSPCRSGGAF